MKIKSLIMATMVGVSLLASPIVSQAKEAPIDNKQMVKSSAKQFKTITMYDKDKVSVQFLDVSAITKDKKIQEAIKRDIKGFVKETATNMYRDGAKITALYKVNAYKHGIVSVTGYFIEDYKGHQNLISEANFNYKKNDTRDVITPYSVEREGNMEAINAHLKGANKRKWGVAVGMPKSGAYPYAFNEKRDLIVKYQAYEVLQTSGSAYETLVPRKVVFKK